ncbi:uncharacterized protein KQ657_002789 [Scheffersomyces spartinae]|uniref:Uncharacterized protein n=1 Tax=Scheffersomyces spartinae TaxID=45513 RepID=A0A9P7V5N5_9ASCO|nr:uncharacterized protein KQ657_002789 [Scheffersomyces spartinae]KAG7191823.1 hypothetical protein KQ657_002789 [Scheffersomyces spartinae]
MSTVTSTKESLLHPEKFRIKHQDAVRVLGDNGDSFPVDESKETLETHSKVAIVGGGFGGVATALGLLKRAKESDFCIFEKHDQLGGTWYANTYPGCLSDIPAIWYSFSDELNTNWSCSQPPQAEMEEYILTVVKKHGIDKKATLKTAITSFEWDEKTSLWTLYGVNVESGQRIKHTASLVVAARGILVIPNHLKVPGLDTYDGVYMHSALWDYDVSFEGKDVLVIGNGCSATQVVPSLLTNFKPKSITQLVSTKQWVMPEITKALHRLYSIIGATWLGSIFCRALISTVAEMRYPMYAGNGWISKLVRYLNEKTALNYMKSTCPPEYLHHILPDYRIGCKRLIFDRGYLQSLHDKRMSLTGSRVKLIDGKMVTFQDGLRAKFDIIVACTGYDVSKPFFMDTVIGENGTKLNELWDKEGIAAYETFMIKSFPNFYLVGGPNSATGHSSVVLAIENGVNFFLKTAGSVISGKDKYVAVKSEAYDRWDKECQEKLSNAVYGSQFGGCASWYTDNGRNHTMYPDSQLRMWYRSSHPNYSDLELK